MKAKPLRRLFIGFLLMAVVSTLSVATPAHCGKCNIHLLTGSEYFYALRDAIDGAKHSIFLAIYLFKTDNHPTNRATGILNALLKAAKRGVETTVIMERSDDPESFINVENEKTGRRLLRAGARVYWDRPDRKLHIKAVVIDHHLIFLGSHNLTHSAMKYNQEMSLMLNDDRIASEIINKISRFPKTPFKRQP
ncbi:MAG: phospholipase [Deltaproteobacteria bacterium]|nr:MAG: phospholipase [Deltaproteobacteria bacterium]